jgi:hypothetical protein
MKTGEASGIRRQTSGVRHQAEKDVGSLETLNSKL